MAGGTYYKYTPSSVAAIIFIVLFAINTALHIWKMFRTKAWFLVPFIVGGFFEIIGYIGRMMNAKEAPNYNKGPYIIQALLLLLGPAFFAASIYMILGRIIIITGGESLAPIKRRWLTKIFVTGDVVSFLVQAIGGVILASASNSGDNSKANLGQKIIILGLIIQIICFGVFIFTSFIFHTRINKKPTALSTRADMDWRKHMWALYAANALIMVRSIFRVVEYVQGRNGYLQSKEIFLYVFDALLMVTVMVILNVIHPSEINAWLHHTRTQEDVIVDSEMRNLSGQNTPVPQKYRQ